MLDDDLMFVDERTVVIEDGGVAACVVELAGDSADNPVADPVADPYGAVEDRESDEVIEVGDEVVFGA